MTGYVVDATLGVKCVIEEALGEQAIKHRTEAYPPADL